ncbi:MAG: ribonuclease HIII [Mollicutes bacterium PWAP]|nr:ribonuclease HIII [Mollicutes bacterium PWAP]
MKEKYKNLAIIGSDETGVGDYLTPLVASSVFVPKQNAEYFEKIGITDSKKINDKKILELLEKIKGKFISSTEFFTQKQYNFLSKKYNSNELKSLLHFKAINYLEKLDLNIDLIIIDKFSTMKSVTKYYKRLLENKEIKPIKNKVLWVENGEMENVSVALASFIARKKFLSLMEEQNKKYGIKFPLGTNKIVESFSKEFVKKHGKKELYNVSKYNFKTTNKIMEELND